MMHAQCRFCKGVMWGAYVEGWSTIAILSTPSPTAHFASGWMCCSVDSEIGE